MKVKNIMFSGFMAVILMGVAGNASAAVQIASKAYVDGELESKASTTDLTNVQNTLQAAIDDKASQSYVGTLPDTAQSNDIVGYIQEKTAGIATEGAMTELSGRVTTAEGKVTALEGKMTTAESDIDTLQGNMTTAQGDITSLKTAMTGTGEGSVAAKISAAITDLDLANTYETKGEAAKVQTNVNTLSGTVEGISGRVTELENADYQNAADVSGAITTAISGLNLANTYEAKGEAAKVQANVNTLSGTVDGISAKVTANEGAISTLQGDVATKAAASDLTALAGRVDTAEGEIDTLQSEMDAVEAKAAENTTAIAGKVAQTAYDTKMSELDAEIAKKFALPEGCTGEGANCVLSSIGGTIQWVDITAPLQ